MKVGLFLGMCHIFLISRGLQKNSLLNLFFLLILDSIIVIVDLMPFVV